MHFSTLLILFIITAIIAISVDRRIQRLKAAQQSGENAPEQAGQKEQSILTALLPSWAARFLHKKPDDQGQRFQAWSTQAFTNQPALHAWLKALPEPAVQALTEHIAEFCTEMGMDLDWLLEQQVQQQSGLAQDMLAIVSHYLQACHTAVLAQDGVQAFKSYREFDQNPYAKTNHLFIQSLFTTLIEQKLTPAKTPTFDQSPEHERQVYMVQAIRQAAEKEPARFQQVLLKVVKKPFTLPVNGATSPTNNPQFNFAAAEKQAA